jgi:hypothetical protein
VFATQQACAAETVRVRTDTQARPGMEWKASAQGTQSVSPHRGIFTRSA